MRSFARCCTAIACLVLGACDSSSISRSRPPATPPEPEPTFSAEVRRTEFGIPHVRAEDWGGLGYGYGYAYAQDNFCVTMREVVIAGSRSAELMGAEGDLQRDLLYRFLNGDKVQFEERFASGISEDVRDLARGFAAGMNRYLRETGVENLAEGEAGCRGASWVYEIDELDLWMQLRRVALGGSSDQGLVRAGLQQVNPPAPLAAASLQELEAPLWASLESAGSALRIGETGSNAVLAGRDATLGGGSVMLGNPHQSWSGTDRLYQVHLTIPGEYDAAGSALQGLPFIAMGFGRDVAFTHTVDFATRFTLYELQLNPNDPMQYLYDGQWRDISSQTVSVLETLDSGEVVTREKTFYSSHHGLIINLQGINPLLGGWPLFNGSLLSIRDANLLTGQRTPDQWIRKSQAADIDEYVEAVAGIGNPVFHEFATDRHGEIFYGQVSAVPHVTEEQYADCLSFVGGLLAAGTGGAAFALDGSRSGCEWGEDADSPADSNLFGFASRPVIRGGGAVGNSNNSYWLSDATAPLEGFPRVMGWLGGEGRQQFLRTRITHQMIAERLAGTDELSETPLFDAQTMKDFMYNNRVHGAEIALDDTLSICAAYLDAPAADAQAADLDLLQRSCDTLAGWDRRVDVDSRGAQVFIEYWKRIRDARGHEFQNVVDDMDFWLVDFDPAQPLTTPRGIDPDNAETVALVIDSLLAGSRALHSAGVALDAPWGEIHYLERNGENVPIHGGFDMAGIFGSVSASLSDGAYRPSSGNSYIQVVTFDDSECPIVDTVLVHSQSTDPASPHHGDQTREYADKRWLRFPFCEEDIVANQIGETLVLEE